MVGKHEPPRILVGDCHSGLEEGGSGHWVSLPELIEAVNHCDDWAIVTAAIRP